MSNNFQVYKFNKQAALFEAGASTIKSFYLFLILIHPPCNF